MKTAYFKSLPVVVLATLALLGTPALTMADDFFPLDVWEEMDAWERIITAGLDPDVSRYNETLPAGFDGTEMVEVSFPFDVWEQLKDLGNINWRKMKKWNAFILWECIHFK